MKTEIMLDDYDRECLECRILPVGGGGNIICGIMSYCKEIAFRKVRNDDLAECLHFDLPSWRSLEIYFPKNA